MTFKPNFCRRVSTDANTWKKSAAEELRIAISSHAATLCRALVGLALRPPPAAEGIASRAEGRGGGGGVISGGGGSGGGTRRVSDENTPLCRCGKSSKLQMVRKEGKNEGRYFYSCAKKMGDKTNCGFFQWWQGKENNSSTSSSSSAPSSSSSSSPAVVFLRSVRGGGSVGVSADSGGRDFYFLRSELGRGLCIFQHMAALCPVELRMHLRRWGLNVYAGKVRYYVYLCLPPCMHTPLCVSFALTNTCVHTISILCVRRVPSRCAR